MRDHLFNSARWLLSFVMVAIGIYHFVDPLPFERIVPSVLPAPRALVYVSGAFEILGGVGLLWSRSRRFAAWGLVALYVAVFPANLNMAINRIPLAPEGAPLPDWMLWGRLPLQGLFIAWAYLIARSTPSSGGHE